MKILCFFFFLIEPSCHSCIKKEGDSGLPVLFRNLNDCLYASHLVLITVQLRIVFGICVSMKLSVFMYTHKGMYVVGCEIKCLKTSDLSYSGYLLQLPLSCDWLRVSSLLGKVTVGRLDQMTDFFKLLGWHWLIMSYMIS